MSRSLQASEDHACGLATQSYKMMKGLQGFSASAEDVPVLLMVDTAGCDMEEQAEDDGDSKRNEGEAKVSGTCNGLYHRVYDHMPEHFSNLALSAAWKDNLLAVYLLYVQRLCIGMISSLYIVVIHMTSLSCVYNVQVNISMSSVRSWPIRQVMCLACVAINRAGHEWHVD